MGRKRLARNRGLMDWLYRRKTGGYYAKHPLTGKPVTIPAKTDAEARNLYAPIYARWLRDVMDVKAKAMADRIRIAEQPAGAETFTAFCTDFREHVLPTLLKRNGSPLSDKTRGDYDRMLRNQVEPAALLAVPLASLKTQTLRQFLSQWIGTPNHYNYIRALLNRVCLHGVDTGKLARNPMDGIAKRPTSKRGVYLGNPEYVRITSHLSEFDARLCDVLYLISHNPGDVLSLAETQITAGRRVDPTTGQERATIEISLRRNKTAVAVEIWDWADSDLGMTIEWFRERKRADHRVSPHVFVYGSCSRRRSAGEPVSVAYVSRAFAKGVTAAGFAKGAYTLRDLRPKGLTDEYLTAGDSDKGGHKTEAMKRHYRRVELPMRAKNNLRLLRKGA